MKRLLLLALVLGFTSTASAQVPRKVLIEKFTNTGCPPCATSDPWFEEFEQSNISKIAVVKFHTSGPDPSDPFYQAQKTWNESNRRATYYGVTGVPTMYYDGDDATNPGVGTQAMESLLEENLSSMPTSPYQLKVRQSIEGDSVIALVTVDVLGAKPAELGDMVLAVVFAERYNKFTGTNGTPFHTDIARKVVPGLTATGEILVDAENPAFTQETGSKTYRFAAKIGTTWDRAQLMSVAFVQGVSSHVVYQTEWTVPMASAAGTGGFELVSAGASTKSIYLKNEGSDPIVLKATTSLTATPGWTVEVQGLSQDQTITLAPGATSPLTLATTASPKGSAMYSVSISTASGMYVGDLSGSFFGEGNDIAIVNGSSTISNGYGLANSLYSTNRPAGVISRTDFRTNMATWDQFKTVLYTAGPNVGIQIGTGEWENAADFVEMGGHFAFMGSQMVSIYAGSGNESYMDNIRDIFGIDPTAARTTKWSNLIGVDGDPIGNGITATLLSTVARQDLELMENAAVETFKNDKGDVVGVRNIVGSGKTALMVFDMDNLADADRTLITGRVMDWFEGITNAVKVSGDANSTELANYPNPFNPSTTIEFSLTEATPVSLVVKDMMGREVATLIDYEMHERGTYHQTFDASNLASGTYVYELTAGSKKLTQKMTLNK
jgi:hypothetical protein